MAEYFGARAICDRMSWAHPSTVPRQVRLYGFLAYQRRRGQNPRRYWYTNDQLITAWEIARCKADREKLLEREAAKDGQLASQDGKAS
jgi:hypothetical protein